MPTTAHHRRRRLRALAASLHQPDAAETASGTPAMPAALLVEELELAEQFYRLDVDGTALPLP